jgi:ribosome-associated protein YbcJ (S4-like RNA binding protein)
MMNKGSFIAFGPAAKVLNEDNLKSTYGIDIRIFAADDPIANEMIRFCIPAEESTANIFAGLPGIENVFYGEAKQENGSSYIHLENGIKIEALTQKTGKVKAYITSNNIAVSTTPPTADGRNVLRGEIKDVLIQDGLVRLEVNTGLPFIILTTPEAYQKSGLAIDSTVYLTFKNMAVQVYGV